MQRLVLSIIIPLSTIIVYLIWKSTSNQNRIFVKDKALNQKLKLSKRRRPLLFSKDDEEDFGTGKFAKYQKMMWDLIEKPDTSRAAQVSVKMIIGHDQDDGGNGVERV